MYFRNPILMNDELDDLPFPSNEVETDRPPQDQEDLVRDILVTPPQQKDFVVIPSGYYEGVITDAGIKTKQPGDKYYDPTAGEGEEWKNQQLQIQVEVQHEGEPASLRHWTSLSLNQGGGGFKQSNLFGLLKSLGYANPLAGFNPADLIGKKAKFLVEKKEKATEPGSFRNNIVGGKYEAI